MRKVCKLALIVGAVVGSLGAARAQVYAPAPGDYYPPPPQPYGAAPLPPLDVGESAMEPGQVPYGPPPGGYRDAPPMPQPYFVPQAAAPMPPGPDQALRPPAEIGDTDIVTGAVRAPVARSPQSPPDRTVIAGLPPEDQPEQGPRKELPPHLRRQLVDYPTSEPAGTIIIDTPHTYLYLIRGNGKAMRYGIGVGREGFTWTGTERISRMSEWPDWHPPKEMIERQPYLPRFMAGGPGNPLGARALYLGGTLYRIHGTNQPSTIGGFVSSGCIRLTNEDIEDLYSRVSVGTRVVVLPGSVPVSASARSVVAH